MPRVSPSETSVDAGLLSAVAHPIRVQLLEVMAGEMSPNRMARAIGLPVANVSYHVKILRDAGIFELVERVAVGSAVENIYRIDEDGLRRLREVTGALSLLLDTLERS